MSLVCEKGKGGVLALNDTTKQEMQKHPKPEPVQTEALLSGEMPQDVHHIFYAAIDGDLIKRCALRTRGGAGVSQQEDLLWHKMTTAFQATSTGLCNSVAALARRLASEYVDPKGLEALLANRGIAIDKCPGLRPVGVGEILRRLVGKAIMQVTGEKCNDQWEPCSCVQVSQPEWRLRFILCASFFLMMTTMEFYSLTQIMLLTELIERWLYGMSNLSALL